MRLVSYNVNSIAMRLSRVLKLLAEHQPDVVCLQETKSAPDGFPHAAFEDAGYVAADSSAGRWAGVALLARTDLGLTDVEQGLADAPVPEEARWVEATVAGMRVASVYVPNGRAVGTGTFREKLVFLEAMARRATTLGGTPAVIAGDMNVCPTDMDVWNPQRVHGSTHVTPDERERLEAVLEAGFVDAYRRMEPEESGFTWWDYRAGAFHKGMGLRIDLAMVSTSLAPGLERAWVDRDYRKPTKVPGTKPSDHAPLLVDVDLQTPNGRPDS